MPMPRRPAVVAATGMVDTQGMTDRRHRIFTVAMIATLPLLWFLILAGWSSWLILAWVAGWVGWLVLTPGVP